MPAKKAAKKAATKKTVAKAPAKKVAKNVTKLPVKKSASGNTAKLPPEPKPGSNVELSAYLNYRDRVAKGKPGGPLDDWLDAEKSGGS